VCNRLDEKFKETLTSSLGQGKMHKAKAVIASTSNEIWKRKEVQKQSRTCTRFRSAKQSASSTPGGTSIPLFRGTLVSPIARDEVENFDNNLKPDYTSSSSLQNKTSIQEYSSGNDIIVID
jgi:hypothetical protein